MNKPCVVAAIPCLNNEKHIESVIRSARKQVDAVVVIDDGSGDGTSRVAKKAGALVVNHVSNLGYGEAINSCFRVARVSDADVLVTLDGDGQHNPGDIEPVVAPILSGAADMVIGSRFLCARGSRIPFHRVFGIKIITFLWNLGSKKKVTDAQSGFRAYSRRSYEMMRLSEKGMGSSIEILEIARRKKAVIKEVAVSCVYHNSRLDWRLIKHGISVVLATVKIRLNSLIFNRNKVGQIAGNEKGTPLCTNDTRLVW